LKSATTNSTSTRQQPANGPVTSDAVRFLALPIMLTGSQLPVCIQLLDPKNAAGATIRRARTTPG